MKQSYDLIIIGGGLVGTSLAFMLAEQGLQIAIVESKAELNTADNRSLVLSYSSYLIFNTLDLWSAVAAQAIPIKKVHVSDRDHFGACRFDAATLRISALGYIVPAALLPDVLYQAVRKKSNIELIAPAKVKNYNADNSAVMLETPQGDVTLTAKLVIAADGSNSKMRQLLNIETKVHDYQQTALIANVTLAHDHQQIAYERLTQSGPLALLPRDKYHCGLIWTVNNKNLTDFLALSDTEFLLQLQKNFGYRLGRFQTITKRDFYPLRLIQAREQIRPRLVLVGNAAHTLHPIAGQGFNLALRDIAVLAQVLSEAIQQKSDIGDLVILQKYQTWRAKDQERIVRFTDGTVRLFSNAWLPVQIARDIGLVAIDFLPTLKNHLTRRLLGLAGRAPKLLCGLPLHEKSF